MSAFQNFLDQALKNIDIEPVEDVPTQYTYDVFEEIRTQVVKIRMDLNITQKELASKSGLTQANVSKIEKGSSHPTIDTLIKLADGLGKRLVIRFDDFEGEQL